MAAAPVLVSTSLHTSSSPHRFTPRRRLHGGGSRRHHSRRRLHGGISRRLYIASLPSSSSHIASPIVISAAATPVLVPTSLHSRRHLHIASLVNDLHVASLSLRITLTGGSGDGKAQNEPAALSLPALPLDRQRPPTQPVPSFLPFPPPLLFSISTPLSISLSKSFSFYSIYLSMYRSRSRQPYPAVP